MEPPDEEAGEREGGRSTGVVGMRISPAFLCEEGGVMGLKVKSSSELDGGGISDEPLERGACGTLAGAKSSLVRCSGAFGGGGRKGVVS